METVAEVLSTHRQHRQAMRPMDVGACWNVLNKLVKQKRGEHHWLHDALRQEPAVLQPLLDTTLRHIPKFWPWPLALTAHGLAVVASGQPGFAPEHRVWEQLAARATQLITKPSSPRDTFYAQQLANTVYAFAKAAHASPALLDAVATEAVPRLSEFKPQELANTMWAYATLGQAAPELFDAVAKEAHGRLSDFKTQELANLVWAYATLENASPALLDAVAKEARGRLTDFNPQGLSNTAWAYATLDHASPELFDAVAKEARGRLRSFAPQGLSNLVWAYAALGHASPELLDAVAAQATGQLRSFRRQGLVNLVWAFATLGHASPALFDAVAEEALRQVHEFKPQELANTAWAYSTLGHASPALLDAVATQARGRLTDFNPQELANTVWAFAALGQAAPALFDAVAKEARGRLQDFKPQELVNVAWAYAVADASSPDLFAAPGFVECCAAAEASLAEEGLCQLHQWQLWMDGCGHPWPRLPVDLAERCHAAFCAGKGTPSRTQRLIAGVLAELDLKPREEVRTPQGYSLDAVVLLSGREVAVEVDGPSHFLGGEGGRTPNGATTLKRRQLRAAGWPLLPVPYWEWEAIRDDAAGRREYLLRGLRREVAATPNRSAR